MLKRPDIDAAEFDLWVTASGLTDVEVAAALGVSSVTVWRWRNDKSPIPAMVRQALIGLEATAKSKRAAEG